MHRNSKLNKSEISSASSSTVALTTGNELSSTNITTHLNVTNDQKMESETKPVMLATSRVIVEAEDGRQVAFLALLDQGSEVCFLSERIEQLLSLSRSRVSTTISGMSGVKVGQISHSVSFLIKSLYADDFEIRAKSLVISKISDYQPGRSV